MLPFALALLAAAVVSFSPRPAAAVTLTVNSFEDVADPNPGDGVCDVDPATAGEQCTLRAAIQTANALKGSDTIQLAAGTYALTLKGPGEEAALSDDLDVHDATELIGLGAGVTIIDAKKLKHRIFEVTGSLDVFGVTLQNGRSPKRDTSTSGQTGGGCIRSIGDLSLLDSVVTGCKSKNAGGGVSIEGGGGTFQDVLVSGNKAKEGGGIAISGGAGVLLSRVTVSGNKASGGGGGGIAVSGGALTLQNVTISGNKAKEGGGLLTELGGTSDLQNATIAFNDAKKGAAVSNGAESPAGTTTVDSTILHAFKKNQTPCVGTIDSLGGNLESAASCGLDQPTDQSSADPLLSPLADNGGATPTHALGAGSPAIDSGLDADCPAADQRSQTRIDVPAVGSALCDVGAFEFAPPAG